MVKVTRHKKTHLSVKTVHSKKKTHLLKDIVKYVTPRKPLLKRVENIKNFK